jgi:opacity protein-like surface antigen
MPAPGHFLAATALAAALSGSALAQADKPARLSIDPAAEASGIRAQLSQQGFDVRKIEFEDRKIEVKGVDASGRCLEIYFHPASGEELRRKHDDDCRRKSRSGDDWYEDRLARSSRLWDDSSRR